LSARVVAYYLSAALAEAPARGVPGVSVTSVFTQRASFGEPLDDVIVHAVLADGSPSKLSLQAKSTLTFTENDAEWVAVLCQAWDTFSSAVRALCASCGLARGVAHNSSPGRALVATGHCMTRSLASIVRCRESNNL
jgi:hypothetical protein